MNKVNDTEIEYKLTFKNGGTAVVGIRDLDELYELTVRLNVVDAKPYVA